MSLTSEQITEIVGKIHGIKTTLDTYDRVEMEQVSNALDSAKAELAGSGSDTSSGSEFVLVIKGDKV